MGCKLLESFAGRLDATKFAQQIYNRRAFQLKASAPLRTGDYVITFYPVGFAPSSTMQWLKSGAAIAPLMDSVVNFFTISPTFTVKDGKIDVPKQTFDVLLDVTYVGSDFAVNPTHKICMTQNAGLIDPLMLDFSGRGIRLGSQQDGLLFDLSGDGEFERVSWPVDSRNMFLLHNLEPGRMQVTGKNMFGNYSPGANGGLATDGFEALRAFDRNEDGVIDRRDPIYHEARLWGDQNHDGVAQPGELHTLTEMNVISIELEAVTISEEDVFGNKTTLRSFANLRNGSRQVIADVWFMSIQ